MDLITVLIIGLVTQLSPSLADTVPCIDKSSSCAADTANLCGRFDLITYDTCRKSCNACDGPTIDYVNGGTKPAATTTIKTTTQTTTTPTTTTPTTTTSTTTPTTATTTTTTTPKPTTTTTTTTKKTTTATTTKATTPSTIKTTASILMSTIQGNAPCIDKISSCKVNANVVCGNDYHFTYDLCRKTCNQCNGPQYTTKTPATTTTTSSSSGIGVNFREIECYYDGQSQQYDGRASMTSPSNHSCVNWATIASINSYKASQFPGGDFHHNFCRDPTNTGRPFCHTLYGTEACGIRKCAGPCEDSTTISCPLFGASACDDEDFARTICPVTCKKCGYGFIIQTRG